MRRVSAHVHMRLSEACTWVYRERGDVCVVCGVCGGHVLASVRQYVRMQMCESPGLATNPTSSRSGL